MRNDKNILISEGNRPIWQLIIAAFFYTTMFVFLFMFFYNFEFTTENVKVKGSLAYVELAILAFTAGLGFSVTQDTVFNLKEKKYKIQY